MYSEWTSLASSLPNKIKPGTDDENVLLRFSADVSRDVASLILKQLASNLGITHTAQLSILETEKDVLWCMEVISYGLNLPLSDHDTIRDCVNVYCEWLSVFDKTPKISVPKPITRDPNFFAKKIITHLYNLFIPRKVEEADGVSKQAVLCHRVLRTLQHIVQNSNILTVETWNCLLLFLLGINDILLFPDITHEDNVADQLCQRVLSVLVEVWLVACQKCFPTPSFWKTFREFSIKWRHRNIVIEQWNTMNLILTSRVLEIMYGTPFLIHKTCPEDVRYIVKSMNNDCVVQTWYRILNNIGNPVDLSHRINIKPNNSSKQLNIISRQSSSEFGVATANYSSPINFFNAMKGLATIIDSFLKISSYKFESYTDVPGKLTCNSILHLFGEWLFEASYSGVEVVKFLKSKIEPPFSELTRSSSTGSQPNSSIELDIDIIAALNGGKYISGYSEALGILCRIFSSKRAKEEILPIYLSRFYTIVQQGLKINELGECTELMISILLNSSTLFRTDLDGILLLITYFVDSLELLLSDKHLKLKTLKNIPESELRGSVINLLLSLLPFPLHYQNMVLKELTTTTKFYVTFTFGHLRSKLVAILINALQFETDCFNTQILLSGLLFLVQDFALYEEIGTFNHMQSAWSLFVKGTYLVCHRLISSWKTDLNISLPALELLSSIAKVQMHQECDVLEYKQIVKWLCDYITVQCSQPPPAHSKDLHSGIVAAFYCIIIWLTENRWLLHDDECLYMLLEVVELGISGSKSQKSKNAGSKMKDEKDSKPASLRVRDASECLLVFILQQVDCKLLINGNGSLIPFPLKKIRASNFGENFLTKDSKFHYFVLDASMMSILYLPTANYNNNEDFFQPTMKFVVRDICGYYTWILQFRQLPRNKSLANQNQGFNYGHPISMVDPSSIYSPNHTFFPERVEKIPVQNIDNCMPSIDDLSKSILQNDSMTKFIDEHKNLEKQPRQKLINFQECVLPSPCTKLNTGRMFLSHFGLFSKSTSGKFPPISSLNSTKAGFEKDLTDLDNTTTASWNLCYIFYMKNGQKNITDIINNIGVEKMLCQHFLEILYSLGWPVKSSFVMDNDSTSFNFFENKGIDSFYWSDLTSQILYTIPTSKLTTNLESKDILAKHPDFDKIFLETDGMTISLTKQCLNFPVISIVWIENYADYANFPIDEMCALIGSLNIHKPVQRGDCCIIFLHLLQNGLLQMKFVGPTTRTGLTASLIDGMVISRRVAGTLIRQTVVNTYKRKTLDNDSYNIPHVRRRSKIQEFVNKYRYKISSPELLEHLLS